MENKKTATKKDFPLSLSSGINLKLTKKGRLYLYKSTNIRVILPSLYFSTISLDMSIKSKKLIQV
jgi:hypothetical protein